MLKTRTDKITRTTRIPHVIEQSSSDGGVDQYYNSLLNNALVDGINPENDYEYATYKFERNELIVDLFFFTYLNGTGDSQTDPVSYATRSVVGDLYTSYENELFNQLSSKQYVEPIGTKRDNVISDNAIKPSKSGVPSFYPSFAYAFGTQHSRWLTDSKLFMDKDYLYNSFLKVDFQTTPSTINQQLIFSKVEWTNPRTSYKHKYNLESLITPSFRVNDDTELYRIQWVSNLPIKTFYVSFTYWNALTGENIRFIPTSKKIRNKQWVQNPNSFVTKNLFLKVVINDDDKTYSMYEYDGSDYTLKVNRLSLYQLVYDEYWSSRKPTIEYPEPSEYSSLPVSQIPKSETSLNMDLIEERKILKYNQSVEYNEVIDNFVVKNVGDGNLILDDIFITYNGSDPRVVSDTAEASEWNAENKFYRRNLYTYPNNQRVYYDFEGSDKVQMQSREDIISPITQAKANNTFYQNRYGEKLSVEYSDRRDKIIESGGLAKFKINFELGSKFAQTYLSGYLNPNNYTSKTVVITTFDNGRQIEREDYQKIEYIPPLDPTRTFVLSGRSYTTSIKHGWKVTLRFLDELGEIITEELDIKLKLIITNGYE